MPNVVIENVGLIAKPRSELAARLIPELIQWLEQRKIAFKMDEECALYANLKQGLSRTDVAAGSQMLIVLGGDGTLLAAARATVGRDIPLFAVNLGGLGFLTAITVEELYSQLEQALEGNYRVGQRRMLHTELWRDDKCVGSYEALNDMVLAKAEIARMIELQVYVDKQFVCVYKADGLIVATPTGSTAYSLSAGGPIMFPGVGAIAITPICPHTLTNRPVIIPDTSIIEVQVLDSSPTYLTIDGQEGELLKAGDVVVCKRSWYSILLVRPPDMQFFDVLREKLKWGER